MIERAVMIAKYLEVARTLVASGPPIDPRTSLIDSGLVDSFALADLIARLETALGVRLPVERLSPGDFDSAELLADRLTHVGIVAKKAL